MDDDSESTVEGSKLTVEIELVGLDEFLDAMRQMEKAVDSFAQKCADLDAQLTNVCEHLTVINNYHLFASKEQDADGSVPGGS